MMAMRVSRVAKAVVTPVGKRWNTTNAASASASSASSSSSSSSPLPFLLRPAHGRHRVFQRARAPVKADDPTLPSLLDTTTATATAPASSSSSVDSVTLVTRSSPVSVPFCVTRTPSLQLPVYIDYRHRGSQVRTVVRRINGDVLAFCVELQRFLGPYAVIEVQNGAVYVKGNYSAAIKQWLETLRCDARSRS